VQEGLILGKREVQVSEEKELKSSAQYFGPALIGRNPEAVSTREDVEGDWTSPITKNLIAGVRCPHW